MRKGYIEIDQVLCKGCQICMEFCPKTSISPADNLNAAGYLPASYNDESECTGCAICALVCPEVCIEVYRD
ncbi:MAG: ferredoxin family protein [Chloroflexi bacterium]|jgi:2-oxoglutarate ferredoxin oxidoreductase subunit delta|nr:ferredoxin family protein [Chloroflexota bacterium]